MSLPASPSPLTFEQILGHHTTPGHPPEYLVKFQNRPYSASSWVPLSALQTDPKGQSLLSWYNKSPNQQRTEPPFYDPLFNTPDRIIAEASGRYLVTWKHLFHCNATWEDFPDESLIAAFHERQTLNFPLSKPQFPHNSKISADFRSYELFGQPLDQRQLFTLRFLISQWNRNESAFFDGPMQLNQRIPCLAFFDCLLRSSHLGPFLCILTEPDLFDWYDDLHRFEGFVAVPYGGSASGRALARSHDFVIDGRCRFHFLLTTIEVLFEDVEFLQAIDFEVLAAFDINYPLEHRSRASLFQRIHARFQVVHPSAPVSKSLALVHKYASFFASPPIAKFLPEQSGCACQHLRDALAEYVESSPQAQCVVRHLDCPLNDIQHFLIKYCFQHRQRQIEDGAFSAVAFAIRSVCVHPFVAFGECADGARWSAEQLLISSDFVGTSTRVGVLRALLEAPAICGKAVLIATESAFFQGVLDDYLTSEGLQPSKYTDDPPSTIATFCGSSGAAPSLAGVDVLIVFDGDWRAWAPLVAACAGSLEYAYHLEAASLLESTLVRLDALPRDAPEFERVCRNAACQSLFCKRGLKPAQIVASGSAQPHAPGFRFVELELAVPVFWQRFYASPRSRDSQTFFTTSKPTIAAFTVAQRDRFVRTLLAVGWNSPDALIRISGLSISEAMAEFISAYVVRALCDFAAPGFAAEVAAVFAQADQKPHVLVLDAFDDPPFRAFLRANAAPLLDRLRVLHCLSLVCDADDFEPALPPLRDWWRHDRALARAVCAYGLPNYEFFRADGDALVREIAARGVRADELDARVPAIAARALEFSLARPLDECLDLPGWTDAEQRAVLEHIDRFGVARDANGDPDCEMLRLAPALARRAPEAIAGYVARVLAALHAGAQLSLETRVRLRIHIDAMDRLRAVARADLRRALQRAPPWARAGPDWSTALERQLFGDMLRGGFHAFRAPQFAQFPLATDAVCDRLRELSAEPLPRDEEAAADAVEFPILITPFNKVHALGRVEWERPAFHSERYIYPIGFKSSRMSASLEYPGEKARWFSEILDGGDGPLFRVWMEGGGQGTVFEGSSPTAPWSQVLRAVAIAKRNPSKVASVSGPEAFLLASPIVVHLIQALPNAEKCARYVFRDVAENPLFRKFQTRAMESEEDEEPELESSDEQESLKRKKR